jgi:hypothetical protein
MGTGQRAKSIKGGEDGRRKRIVYLIKSESGIQC